MENFNWVDFIIIILVCKSAIIGSKVGLTGEFFKLLGAITSIVLGLHYHKIVADILSDYLGMPFWFLKFVVLLVILFSIRAVFKYGVVMLLKVFNIQFVLALERVGGILLGFFRASLLVGLLLIAISFVPIKYIYTSIYEKSMLGNIFVETTKTTYISIMTLIPSVEPQKVDVGPPEKK